MVVLLFILFFRSAARPDLQPIRQGLWSSQSILRFDYSNLSSRKLTDVDFIRVLEISVLAGIA